ncbi:unnamed protein product [Linum trigynum]|uniref:Thioredoxin domain-containing protein n=1 Tax=Linum trigynum TaxID=586398 RepID=A0AAV2DJT3_9ROSI
MSEAVHLSRAPPIGALPSSRRKSTSIASSPSSFPSLARRNRSLTSFGGVLSLSRKCRGSNHSPAGSQLSGGKVGVFNVWNGEASVQELDDAPVSIELEPICSETQFDRLIADAQQLDEGVIVVWTAKWCRKCIYLEPKLKRLAAEYHPRLRFYRVDVNNVPHSLVARAGVTKMPTIQMWKDGKKQGEVIGGHKAHLVVNEIRDMIENNDADI